MKLYAFILGLLLCAAPVAVHAAVGVGRPLASTQKPRITVLLGGQPVQHARVEVLAVEYPATHRISVAHTNAEGVARLHKLDPGLYEIKAFAQKNLIGVLALKVMEPPQQHHQGPASALLPESERPQSRFDLPLAPSPYPTADEMLAAAEREPIDTTVSSFQGSVTDLTGARIPNVEIEILHRGTARHKRAAHLRTDDTGLFTKKLKPGEYIARVSGDGFMVTLLPFRVDANGETKSLKIVVRPDALMH